MYQYILIEMKLLLTYSDIDPQQWQSLVERSPYATWFQTPEAYRFYAAVNNEMTPFAFGIENDGELRAVVVGYVTKANSVLKQFFTRRAIVIGGPLIGEHATELDVEQLLHKTAAELKSQAIYIETRNFHDYSRWKSVYEANGFTYQPHLNFHVDTSSEEVVDKNLGKSRKRDIRTTIRDGVTPVLNPTIEQVREYYAILKDLYTTKVKTPLFSWHFFEQLYHTAHGRFILTEYQGKIIGGTVCVMLPGKALYEWFVCGIDGVYEHIFPSSYATYLGIRYAAENGCQIFDMMGAGKPEEAYGVRDFKARFGGEQVEHGRFICIRKSLLYKIGELGVYLLKFKK